MRDNEQNFRIVLMVAFLCAFTFAAGSSAKNWNTTNGNWNTAANWSPASVPVASEDVNIVNSDGVARTVTLDTNTPALRLLAINQTGGTAVNTLSIPISNNNFLTSNALFVGGWTGGIGGTTTNGRGAVNQANGTVTMVSGTDLVVGFGSGSTGTYTLSGGNLVGSQSEFIGSFGNGTFTQSGGTNSLPASAVGYLNLGYNVGGIGTYNLSGGTLTAAKNEIVGDAGTGFFNQTGGSNKISGGHHLYLANDASNISPTGGTYTLSAGTLEVNGGNEYVGYNRVGAFIQSGGTNTVTGDIYVGFNTGSSGTYNQTGGMTTCNYLQVGNGLSTNTTYKLSGTASLSADTATVRGSLEITSGGTMNSTGFTTIEAIGSGPGSILVQDPGSSLTANGGLSVGHFVHGTLEITNGGSVTSTSGVIGDYVSAGSSATVTGAGSVWNTGSLRLGDIYGGTGTLTIGEQGLVDAGASGITIDNDSTVNLQGGTIRFGSYARNAAVTVNFQAGTVKLKGDHTVGADDAISDFFGIVNSATITAGKALTIEGNTTIATSLTLDGGTLTIGNLTNNGTFNFDAGTLNVNQASANVNTPIVTGNPSTINISANSISLGSASSFNGFQHQGTLNVGANTVTLNSAGYARLGTLTTLAGGTLNAPNGIYISGGGNLTGSGTVNARVTGDTGSVIEASGALALGSASSPAGFNFDGEIRTKQFAVTLNSSAASGLGNLTTLGNGATPGTLNATNGFVVDFDEAITGYGTINSTNSLAKHATINGTVQGNSAGQPITLSGYIKGTGSFTNVTFSGTYSPGLSPTAVTAGNLSFAASNTLIMELGGTNAGSEFDQIQSTGALALGGALQVSLFNGFSLVVGNSFDLLNWTTLSGTFSSISLPTLTGGLTWNTSQLYTMGILSVASAGTPGDYNNNGTVDAGDYILYRKYAGTAHALPNDPTGGTIGVAQYTTWRSNFGRPPGSGAGTGAIESASSAVPEPASLGLLFLSAVGWCFRRRGPHRNVPSTHQCVTVINKPPFSTRPHWAFFADERASAPFGRGKGQRRI